MKKKLFLGTIVSILGIVLAPGVSALSVDSFSALQDAVNSNEKEITLTTDVEGDLVIPAGSDITLDGENNTLTGTIQFVATIDEDKDTTKFELRNLVLDGNNTKNIGITSQNQATDPVKLYLTMTNVTVKNFTGKGTYFTNVQELIVTSCDFNNNATTTQTPVKGDYAFDINLVGIQDAIISIQDCTFGGASGGNAPIKVTQRGGEDDIMKDIPYYRDATGANRTDKAAASIKYLSISNNDFSSVTGNKKGDVIIGSSPNADGTARTSASNYSYEVIAKTGTTTNVYIRSTTEEEATTEYKATEVTETTPLRNGMVAFTLQAIDEKEVVYVPKGTMLTDEEIAIIKAFELEGYKLVGFFSNLEYTEEFDFTKALDADTTLYIQFAEITPADVVANPSTGDINIIALTIISVLSLTGLGYSVKAVLSRQ